MNAGYAVQGLLRDLNHHIPTFRNMARVTLADWTCMPGHCVYPLADAGLAFSFNRQTRNFPSNWITAHSILREQRISIRQTDLSYVYSGDAALRHILRLTPVGTQSPLLSLDVVALERRHITHMRHLVNWDYQPGNLRDRPIAVVLPALRTSLAGTTALLAAERVAHWLAAHAWDVLTPDHDLLVPPPLGEPWRLALPRDIRMHQAEQLLISLCRLALNPGHGTGANIAVSDASMVPAAAHRGAHRSVIAAAASDAASIAVSLASFEKSAGILHGEVYAIIIAYLLSKLARTPVDILYSDHQNSTRLINDALRHPPLQHAWSARTGRPLYRWLMHILSPESPDAQPNLAYTPAHTGNLSTPALANTFVDSLAGSAQAQAIPPVAAPVPTFTMDDFMIYTPAHSYVDTDPRLFVEETMVDTLANDFKSFRPASFMSLSLYDSHPPPEHPYVRASAAYSATVQLYAHSQQLDTKLTRFVCLKNTTPWCSFGCDRLETAHHIFVVCPSFKGFRDAARKTVHEETSAILENADLAEQYGRVVEASLLLFSDTHIWPARRSHFFLGVIPPVLQAADAGLLHSRTLTRVAGIWHSTAIRLAARIWGDYKRRTNTRPRHMTSRRTPLSLPPHLQHLAITNSSDNL
ncbi:hypothetical protein HGRIS_013047 [Hohenbuehelia grisea]|uniref:Reverse transcriptase n=1 Tax=Hohenbuehelia grisea TaxID=104357 RepID=A0ABR3IU93_9AGAR